MMKRLTWFLGGAAAGIAGASVAKKKVKAAAAELAPSNIARKTTDRVRDAVQEGKRAMRAKEAEMRAAARLAAVLGTPEAFGGGSLTDAVLKQVRDRNEASGRSRRRA